MRIYLHMTLPGLIAFSVCVFICGVGVGIALVHRFNRKDV